MTVELGHSSDLKKLMGGKKKETVVFRVHSAAPLLKIC